ncbi:unnamed protein product [Amoebophrya sp. A25]|nr:unnamed protein product [Amoebophrya sp. A25]|eukprot:GSA25T00008244001.1
MGKKGRWGGAKTKTPAAAADAGAAENREEHVDESGGLHLLGGAANHDLHTALLQGGENTALQHIQDGFFTSRGGRGAAKQSEFEMSQGGPTGAVSMQERLMQFLTLTAGEEVDVFEVDQRTGQEVPTGEKRRIQHAICQFEGFCNRKDMSVFENLMSELEFRPTYAEDTGHRLRREVIDPGMHNYEDATRTGGGATSSSSSGSKGGKLQPDNFNYYYEDHTQSQHSKYNIHDEGKGRHGKIGNISSASTTSCTSSKKNKIWDQSPTYRSIIRHLIKEFGLRGPYFSVINLYRDEKDKVGYHRDSYKGNVNFTVGVSLGASRDLEFISEIDFQRHAKEGTIGSLNKNSSSLFSFPQGNGDIFAFSDHVNRNYRHGVLPHQGGRGISSFNRGISSKVGPRISVVLWGERGNGTDPGVDREDFVPDFGGIEGERIIYLNYEGEDKEYQGRG